VSAAPDLGPQQTKLRQQLAKAKERTERSETQCRGGSLRRAKSELVQAIMKTIQVKQTLRSRQARKSMPPDARSALLAAVAGIQDDMHALKVALACPADADAPELGPVGRFPEPGGDPDPIAP
jgi:hypothetical protein